MGLQSFHLPIRLTAPGASCTLGKAAGSAGLQFGRQDTPGGGQDTPGGRQLSKVTRLGSDFPAGKSILGSFS